MSVDTPVVRFQTTDPREAASWEGLADLAALMPSGWSLAGGGLVRLPAAERGSPHSRATRDIDLILDGWTGGSRVSGVSSRLAAPSSASTAPSVFP